MRPVFRFSFRFDLGNRSCSAFLDSVRLTWFGAGEALMLRIVVNNPVDYPGVNLFMLCDETKLTRLADLSPPFPQVFPSVFHSP
jgi:hypothetical protein